MATKYKVFQGNSRKVGTNQSLPHIGMTGTHTGASVPAPSVKAYLDALAAVKSNTAMAANAATAAQTQPAGGGGGGGSVAAAPAAAGPAGSGDPILDGLNAQLSTVQGQLQTDTNTQNAQAQAARDRIAQGNTALQGQIGQLGQQQAAGNAAAGSSINNVYAQAQTAAAAQAAASQNDLASQGFNAAPLQAQAGQRSQDLTDQAARQSALQQRLAQISGNDFTSKQANAQEYTTGAGAVLEAALAKNLGVLGTNSAKTQQDIKDAISQEQADFAAAGGSGGGGGGGGGRKKSGGGGGAGGSGPGGALVPGDPGYQLAPGDLGDATKYANAANADQVNATNKDFYDYVGKITKGLKKGTPLYQAGKQLQTHLLGTGPAGVPGAIKAWDQTQSQFAAEQRNYANKTTDSQGQLKQPAKPALGYAHNNYQKLLDAAAKKKADADKAAKKKVGTVNLGASAAQVSGGGAAGVGRTRKKTR